MKFLVLYKDVTSRGSNYYKLSVEIANGIWVDAVYFGNTTPKAITRVIAGNNGWMVEIQQHQSRDRDTGRFKKLTWKVA